MIKHNMRFLSGVVMVCVFGTAGAHAAPSVRMLGTNTARIGSNATVVKSDNTNTNTSTQRLGTIRSKAVNVGAPVTVNKIATPSVVSNTDSDARLSLGKYIHSAGVSAGTIKPVSGITSTAGVSSDDFLALSDQVRDLKNTKQDLITVGNGLVQDGDSILLDPLVLKENINTVLEGNYYTSEEVDKILEQQSVTNNELYDTYKEVYTPVTIVDAEDFDANTVFKLGE